MIDVASTVASVPTALSYEEHDFGNYDTRILIILPDPPEAIVRCKMEQISILTDSEEDEKYYALSFCWGDKNVTKTIIEFRSSKKINPEHSLGKGIILRA